MFDWDEDKRQANLAKHGVDFAEVVRFDWETADMREDFRSDYGERRIISTGYIGDRLHVCIWTQRGGRLRIIGLRKANPREQRRYDKDQKLH
jgi:uncharacterized protein